MDRGSDDLDWLYRRGAHSGEPEWVPVAAPVNPPRQTVPFHDPGPGRRRRGRPLRTAAVVLAGATLIYFILVPVFALSQGRRVDATPEGDRPPQMPGHVYLLTGSDGRGPERDDGSRADGNARADTIMLLYLPMRGRPVLLSVPRDSYVEIPGHGSNKINAALAFGGPKLLVQTVERRTGLRVAGYVEVGFGGFVDVVDSVGGINMCLPDAIRDRDSHLDVPAGCQHFDGHTALGYVRMRKADPEGDLGRVRRQREVLAAVARQSASPATLLNPVRYVGFNQAVAKSVVAGDNLGAKDVARLVSGMMRVAGSDGLTLTVPIRDANARTKAGSSVLWDDEAADELFSGFARGDTSDLERFRR